MWPHARFRHGGLREYLSILFIIVLLLSFLLSEALVQLGGSQVGGAPSLRWLFLVSPVAGALSGVHLGEQKSQNSLSVLPVEVTQLYCDLLLVLGQFVLLLLHVHEAIGKLLLHGVALILLVLCVSLIL